MANKQPSDDIHEHNLKYSVKDQLTSDDNVICKFCVKFVTQAKRALNNTAKINQVRRQWLDSACDFLTVIDQDRECKKYLHKYIDRAIEFIRDIKPKKYCRFVQMCPANSVAPPSSEAPTKNQLLDGLPKLADFQDFDSETSMSIGEQPDSIKKVTSTLNAPATGHKTGLNCSICMTVIEKLFLFLRHDKTEENIMKAIDKVYSLFYQDGHKRNKYNAMVNTYTKKLARMLIDGTGPEVICLMLEQSVYQHVSRSEQQPLTATAVAESVFTDETSALGNLISASGQTIKPNPMKASIECKMFINYLKERPGHRKTQDELTEWIISTFCVKLKDLKLINTCSKVVQKNAPTLFKTLSRRLNSHAACAELGVCPANSLGSIFKLDGQSMLPSLLSPPLISRPERQPNVEAQINRNILHRPPQFKGPFCEQCIETVIQIDDYLSNQTVGQDVASIMDKICNKSPEGAARDKCTYIIEVFRADIVQAISTMDNARQLCSKFYLC